jgi:CheY-like chemotaxis protein
VSAKCILCVDDDADTLKLRKLLLESSGYRVITAASGAEALDILRQGTTVDLVLLDFVMTGMNGDELAQKLRLQYPQLPIVVVSAVGQLPASLMRDANVTIQKGQGPEVLIATVAHVLARAEEEVEPAPESKKTVLCVEDEELQLKGRRMLFESAGYCVLEARSAHAAMEQFRSRHVDAVVADYWLSGQGGNGSALAEQMKRMRPRIPIVMLSAFGSLPGEGAVVDSWMRKAEIEPENLVKEVQRLIELRASQQPSGEPE